MTAIADVARMAHDVITSRDDAVWFAEEKLALTGEKFYLDEWQKELMQSVSDVWRKICGRDAVVNKDGKSLITVRAMHGPGKTFGVAAVMHWFNFCFRGRIICTAPKERQLHTRLWPAFRRILAQSTLEYKEQTNIRVEKTAIIWNNNDDHCAIAETASQPENLAGYHDDYMLFVVDEASGVDEAMFPVIEGAISTGKLVVLILIGNPTKNQGTFYASHMKPIVAKHYYRVHVDLSKTTRVSKEWVKRMEDKYGRDSPVVKVRCYGEFADTDSQQLIPLSWLNDALNNEKQTDGSTPKLRVTCDVADGGEDETVVTAAIMYDNHIHFLEQRTFSFPTAESPILAARATIAMFNQYGGNKANGDDMVVDSLGVGAGAAGTIMDEGYQVIVYKGGAASDDPKQWRNRRTQSYICMRDAFRRKQVSFAESFEADWDDITAQICTVRTKPGVDRLEDLETKEQLKKNGNVSPDKADGIAMTFATQTPSIGTMLGEAVGLGQTESSNADW